MGKNKNKMTSDTGANRTRSHMDRGVVPVKNDTSAPIQYAPHPMPIAALVTTMTVVAFWATTSG